MSINITVTQQAIVAESTGAASLDDLLAALNSVEGDLADAIFEVMPSDYDLIINEEQYGELFALGSPQIMECGWNFQYSTDANKSSVTITNFR